MIDFDKIRQDQLKRIDNFEACCKVYAEDCPVIIELLESHEMVQYNLFKVYKGNLESMESIAHSLHHAFVDDGAWHIARELDVQGTTCRGRLNKLMVSSGKLDKVKEGNVYRYYLEAGDSETNGNIDENHLSEMIKLDTLHYNYYEANKEAIERRINNDNALGIRGFSDENKEYFRLSRLLDKYLEKVYMETLWVEDDEEGE